MKPTPLISIAVGLTALVAPLRAQNVYNSGSTGADGAFNPLVSGGVLTGAPAGSTWTNVTGNATNAITVPLNASGVYNFTTINIPANYLIRFLRNSNNTPVVWLATGDVTIAGWLSVAAEDTDNLGITGSILNGFSPATNTPGPGGFPGGDYNQPGSGPYAGIRATNVALVRGGNTPVALPLRGGSGGSGGQSVQGGGGGGVLYLASSTKIQFSGSSGIVLIGRGDKNLGADYGGQGGDGQAALFANQVVNAYSIGRAGAGAGLLVCALQSSGSYELATFPPTLSGINIPSGPRPSARITAVGGTTIPTNITSANVFNCTAGANAVNIETRNLTVGIVFQVKAYTLNTRGEWTSIVTNSFPPTVGNQTLATTSGNVTLGNGVTLITAVATAPVDIAYSPSFNGDRINRMVMSIDSDGRSVLQYMTAKGAVMSHDAAMQLAFQQGKWQFIARNGS